MTGRTFRAWHPDWKIAGLQRLLLAEPGMTEDAVVFARGGTRQTDARDGRGAGWSLIGPIIDDDVRAVVNALIKAGASGYERRAGGWSDITRQDHEDRARFEGWNGFLRTIGKGARGTRLEALAWRDGSASCAYCGAIGAEIEHVVPLARGGRDAPHNLVIACAPCNTSKSARDVREWGLSIERKTERFARALRGDCGWVGWRDPLNAAHPPAPAAQ